MHRGIYYILAVNPNNTARNPTFTLAERMNIQKAETMYETHQSWNAGTTKSFIDYFAKYEVHIYKLT